MVHAVKEISDEQYLAQREQYQLVEPRPVPVQMDDAERYEWLAEYCDAFVFLRQSRRFLIIDCDGRKTIEKNLAEAVSMAAAKFREANE